MNADRELRTLGHPDQWARCSHRGIALLPEGGVELTWEDDDVACPAGSGEPAGLAFDRWCRGYRSRPRSGTVDVVADADATTGSRPRALETPRGLAVDRNQRLYVAESCGGVVRVVDLWAQRELRRVSVRTARHPRRQPLDLAARGADVVVLLDRPEGLVILDGRRNPRPGPPLTRVCYPDGLRATRVAAHGSSLLVLWTSADGSAAVLTSPDGAERLSVSGATDLDFQDDGVLVVARRPGQAFLRFRREGTTWSALEPLRADGYDGGAVTVAPDGRVGFTTSGGWSWTGGSAAKHVGSGTVLTYRLDSGGYRSRWGRVFLDACLPAGTSLNMRFLTSDEDDVADPVEATPAARGALPVRHPDLTPPLPPRILLNDLTDPVAVFRRPCGSELPWEATDPADPFQTYDCPVTATPGRYLWILLELSGNARVSPRVRSLRVEAPGHRLAYALPRAWSAQERDAAYLQRFLAPAEGLLHELDERAALRAVLLDPSATPAEALAWLGSLLGLALDERWPAAARRELVAAAFELFRIRGTQRCLERLLRIYLGIPVVVIENWRLRGLGGGVLGAAPGGSAAPAVGAGTYLAGQLGRFSVGGSVPGADGYTATAHRFTVLVGVELGREREQMVRHIVETHKPAHTEVTICQIGDGMRLGRTSRVGLTSFVGAGTGWSPAVVGQVLVGADGVIGLPSPGSRVSESTVVGEVRVG